MLKIIKKFQPSAGKIISCHIPSGQEQEDLAIYQGYTVQPFMIV